jgi:hypothetical protein
VELAADVERVRADNLRHRVAQIERVIPLIDVGDGHTHDERREDDILDAFKLRRLHDDAGRANSRHEALRLKGYSQTAVRLADVIRISQKTDVELIHGCGARNLRVADGNHLRLTDG